MASICKARHTPHGTPLVISAHVALLVIMVISFTSMTSSHVVLVDKKEVKSSIHSSNNNYNIHLPVPENSKRPCPCADPDLCNRIKKSQSPEVFVFSVSPKNYLHYDWTKVTTVVEVGYHDDNLVCHAHGKGVRVASIANFPTANLTDPVAMHHWVKSQIKYIQDNFLDGVNVDFESEIDMSSTDLRGRLLALIKELVGAAKALGPEVQVTMDYAWSPDCIDSRCYDYALMANMLDFVFIMAYDERSQIYGECIAWANSAYNNTLDGLEGFMSRLNIARSKLVLGVPWYGYKYDCTSYDEKSHKCAIRHVPFRGVSCSDAAGRQYDYNIIVSEYLPKSFTGLMWDEKAKSPYFSVKDVSGEKISQIWYDNPESLRIKYQLAGQLGLRGVGMWTADSIDYSNHSQISDIWGALP